MINFIKQRNFPELKYDGMVNDKMMKIEYEGERYNVIDVFSDFGCVPFPSYYDFYGNVFLPSLLFEQYKIEFAKYINRFIPSNYSIYYQTSGAECTELALKIAINEIKERGEHPEIVAFHNDFHGRTMASLNVSFVPHYYKNNIPDYLDTTFKLFTYNSIIDIINNKNIKIVIADSLGQGDGDLKMRDMYLLKKLKKERPDIIIILDETQLYMRNGKTLFAWQMIDGFKPDIFFSAKGVANGLPLGLVFIDGYLNKWIDGGKHHSTFGGEPIVLRNAINILKKWSSLEFSDFHLHPDFIGLPFLFVVDDIKNESFFIDMLKRGWLVSPLRLSKGFCKIAPPLSINKGDYNRLKKDILELRQ